MFLFFHENWIRHFETICMKCEILFCGKNINLSSAEFTRRLVKVNFNILELFSFFIQAYFILFLWAEKTVFPFKLNIWHCRFYFLSFITITVDIGTSYLLIVIVLNLEQVYFKLLKYVKPCGMIRKQCRPWSDAAERRVWSGFTLFARPACLNIYDLYSSLFCKLKYKSVKCVLPFVCICLYPCIYIVLNKAVIVMFISTISRAGYT